MKGTMKVAVMNGIGKMGYTTRPIPTPVSYTHLTLPTILRV